MIAFDHRQSTLARIPKLGQCPSNVEFHIDVSKSSVRSVFDYFSKKLAGTESDSVSIEKNNHLCSLSCMIKRNMRVFFFHTANV